MYSEVQQARNACTVRQTVIQKYIHNFKQVISGQVV